MVFSTSHDKTAKVWFNEVEEHHKACIRTFRVKQISMTDCKAMERAIVVHRLNEPISKKNLHFLIAPFSIIIT